MYSLKRICTRSGVNPLLTGLQLALVTLVLSACGDKQADEITVDSAWVRSMPPGSNSTAAYFTIHNNTSEAIEVTGAGSAEFSSASLHNSVVTDGVAKMVKIPVLVVEPGESVSLEPGGKHLMLTGGKFTEIPVDCCALRLEFAVRTPLLFYAPLNR